MTDYSDWVLKDEYRGRVPYGPKECNKGYWHYVVEFEDGRIESGRSEGAAIEALFKPPVKWTYYQETGDGSLLIRGEIDGPLLTHRSKDGGDTIERIK